jgi:hypothetical protein
MMTDTRTLAQMESEIDSARTLAQAEMSWAALPDRADNPFTGACDKLRALESEAQQMRLRAKGEQLVKAHAELQQIEAEVERLNSERQDLDGQVADLGKSELILKWQKAPAAARALGWGHSWEMVAAWFMSNKARAFAPSDILSRASWPPALLFDEGTDRATIIAWREAEARAAFVTSQWQTANAKRDHLLSRFPELKAVA